MLVGLFPSSLGRWWERNVRWLGQYPSHPLIRGREGIWVHRGCVSASEEGELAGLVNGSRRMQLCDRADTRVEKSIDGRLANDVMLVRYPELGGRV